MSTTLRLSQGCNVGTAHSEFRRCNSFLGNFRTFRPRAPYLPYMDTTKIDALIAELTPREIDRLPWMLDVAVRAGWMKEAELWRVRVGQVEEVFVS